MIFLSLCAQTRLEIADQQLSGFFIVAVLMAASPKQTFLGGD